VSGGKSAHSSHSDFGHFSRSDELSADERDLYGEWQLDGDVPERRDDLSASRVRGSGGELGDGVCCVDRHRAGDFDYVAAGRGGGDGLFAGAGSGGRHAAVHVVGFVRAAAGRVGAEQRGVDQRDSDDCGDVQL
jgi:hypothetical protein